MSVENGVILDLEGNPLYWHVPANRSVAFLPDSRDLWDVIWENRHNISGFAHSHPGSGPTGPSWTDLTTFAAIEIALGKRLDWWITSEDRLLVMRWAGPDKYGYNTTHIELDAETEHNWLDKLRQLSYKPQTTTEVQDG